MRPRHDGRLPCGLQLATIICSCQPTSRLNQFRSPVCATVKDCLRGPILCSCCSRLWNSLPTSITSAGSLAIFKKQLKTFLFRTAYDWHLLLTFSVNSVKRLQSDLSHTPLYKLTYYIHIMNNIVDIKRCTGNQPSTSKHVCVGSVYLMCSALWGICYYCSFHGQVEDVFGVTAYIEWICKI